jgi:hypothetical protein
VTVIAVLGLTTVHSLQVPDRGGYIYYTLQNIVEISMGHIKDGNEATGSVVYEVGDKNVGTPRVATEDVKPPSNTSDDLHPSTR